MNDLQQKTNGELRNIMRDSIDNSYVPSSIYNKAKQELDFRNIEKQNKDEEIIKFSPELYGIGINFKLMWKKVKIWFRK